MASFLLSHPVPPSLSAFLSSILLLRAFCVIIKLNFVYYQKLLRPRKTRVFRLGAEPFKSVLCWIFFFFFSFIFLFPRTSICYNKKWSFPGKKANIRCLGSMHLKWLADRYLLSIYYVPGTVL